MHVMRAQELKHILDRRPFTPIRLHMSNGERVEVTHPDAAIVTQSLVFVGLGVSPEGIADRTSWYNLLHIVKVEPIQRNGSSRGKGRRAA
jgi:hypothetical protein